MFYAAPHLTKRKKIVTDIIFKGKKNHHRESTDVHGRISKTLAPIYPVCETYQR